MLSPLPAFKKCAAVLSPMVMLAGLSSPAAAASPYQQWINGYHAGIDHRLSTLTTNESLRIPFNATQTFLRGVLQAEECMGRQTAASMQDRHYPRTDMRYFNTLPLAQKRELMREAAYVCRAATPY